MCDFDRGPVPWLGSPPPVSREHAPPPPPLGRQARSKGQQEFDSEAGSIRRMATTKIVQEKKGETGKKGVGTFLVSTFPATPPPRGRHRGISWPPLPACLPFWVGKGVSPPPTEPTLRPAPPPKVTGGLEVRGHSTRTQGVVGVKG